MSRLVWNAVGERKYEAGVDRGVLYISNEAGVPWNGLISITEAPQGGVVTGYYLDGIKYQNKPSNEEFKATIVAYAYPEEFGKCDGTLAVSNGLFATNQDKVSFGLAYRTMVGNDLEGLDSYRIHLIYGVTAAPSESANNTISESIDPFNFSWEIFTKPEDFTGFKHTSHFIIEAKDTPADLLSTIEDILYGSEETQPRLPSSQELIFLFEDYDATLIDAEFVGTEYFATVDADYITESYTSTIDGGSP